MAVNIPQITLIEAVGNAFGRQGKKAAQEADKLNNWFESYYHGTGDSDILLTPLAILLRDPGSFTAGIEAGLRSYPKDKQIQASRLLILLQYIVNQYSCSMDLEFLQNFKCRSREERLLRILKYLHDGSKSRADIADTFGISERTLNQDLKILLDGFEFMDISMKVSKLQRGNTYSSLIHPLFLALRTDEIFSLTVGLKLLSRGTIFEDTLGNIADTVYKQLSPYAQKIVDQHSKSNNISYSDSEMQFVKSDDLMKKQTRSKLPYYLKEPIACWVQYDDAGVEKQAQGCLHFYNDGNERWQKVMIKNEEEEIVIGIKDVIRIAKEGE